MADDQYKIEILDKSINVIEVLLNSGGRPLGPSEIARKLGINRTRTFRILKTLERRGYVELVSQTQAYRLGLKFLVLGEKVRTTFDLSTIAGPILSQLARTTGDAAYLMVLYGDQALCVDAHYGEYMLQASIPFDRPLPLHVGASPKILLAYLPEEERERILSEMKLEPFTDLTITNIEQLRQQLDQIREQGYVVDKGDFEAGVYAFGAPLFDYRGIIVAGISLTIPANRFNLNRQEEIINLVVLAAKQISQNLGYGPQNENTAFGNDSTPRE
jgi:DNA-binding IclR family transcriptional regulator